MLPPWSLFNNCIISMCHAALQSGANEVLPVQELCARQYPDTTALSQPVPYATSMHVGAPLATYSTRSGSSSFERALYPNGSSPGGSPDNVAVQLGPRDNAPCVANPIAPGGASGPISDAASDTLSLELSRDRRPLLQSGAAPKFGPWRLPQPASAANSSAPPLQPITPSDTDSSVFSISQSLAEKLAARRRPRLRALQPPTPSSRPKIRCASTLHPRSMHLPPPQRRPTTASL